MEKTLHKISVAISILIAANCYSQSVFAKLDKNRNIQANSLFHELNTTKDTLILRSDRKINYLYSINEDHNREIDFNVNSKDYKLPINKLNKGKHVMVAVQTPLRIVFVLHVEEKLTVASSDFIEESAPIKTKEQQLTKTNLY